MSDTLARAPWAPPDVRYRRPTVSAVVVVVVVGVALSTNPLGRLVAIGVTLWAAVTWSVRRVLALALVLFIAVDDPAANPYNGLWTSPIQRIGYFWYDTIRSSVAIPIRVAPMVIVAVVLAVRAVTHRTGPNLAIEPSTTRLPRQFGPAVMLAGGVVVMRTIWGVGTGGSSQQVYYQVFGICIAVALTVATAHVATPGYAAFLWRIVVAVAVYRALVAIYVWYAVARTLPTAPLYLTSHLDSLIWVLAMVWCVSRLIECADRSSRIAAATLMPILALAVVVNNRRLAWVIAMASLAYVVFSSSSAAKRRLRSVSAVAGPLLAVYFALGLVAPPGPVFAPVQSVASVVVGNDRSSQTREIEDYNLLFTARAAFPFPTGFGKPYIEAVVADDISAAFPQYRYLPHNSLLGMLTLVGPIGLSLLMLPLVLGVRASARLRRATEDPGLRTTTALIMTTWIGFLAHAWGDLGLFTPLPTALVGLACGLGLGLDASYEVNSHQEVGACEPHTH